MAATADHPDGYQCFLVECYVPQSTPGKAANIAARLREGARAVSTGAEAVLLLNLIAVPGDDMCFGAFECDSAELVKAVLKHAGIEYERIVDAVYVGGRGG